MNYQLAPKTAFLTQLRAINPADYRKVSLKVEELTINPEPDAKNKKRLKCGPDLYRLRIGEYRVIYTFGADERGNGYVSPLGVDNRDDVYDDCPTAEGPGFDTSVLTVPLTTSAPAPTPTTKRPAHDPKNDLPFKFTDELLERLVVPDQYRAGLKQCTTLDHLLSIAIPESLRESLFNLIAQPNWLEQLTKPSVIVENGDELIRYAEGELIEFLLKLDPEQEALVRRAVNGRGPMLVKGGPGTGKSTIALYRVREMIAALRNDGVAQPRILFTTYTNALTSASRQQLERLLGADAHLVDVRTADSVITLVLNEARQDPKLIQGNALKTAITGAIAHATFDDNPMRAQIQRRTVERLGSQYLQEEILTVIEGRDIATLEEYQAAVRSGRGVPLSATQREAVWRVHEALQRELSRTGKVTWSGRRRLASRLAATSSLRYDGVLIDEAQDLEPVALRLLVQLCTNPDRLFVTADANQSVYGAGFRWSDVHDGLRFRGRTGTLRTNHRSTLQIDRAARAYLDHGAATLDESATEPDQPDDIGTTRRYARTTGMLPIVREVPEGPAVGVLLARYVREATRHWHMGLGACGILVPMAAVGERIAEMLNEQGIAAEFVDNKSLDLSTPTVKVLTLKSAKGLEFPFVAVAGFQQAFYPNIFSPGPDSGELELGALAEALACERRSIYVGMTRAMLALMVVVPPTPKAPVDALYRGFPETYWNVGATEHRP